MSDSVIRQTIRRGVGRRIFGLFLFAAIIPMAATATLAYIEFHRGLETEAAKSLKNSAKDYGVEILTRLDHATEKSGEVVRLLRAGGFDSVADYLYLLTDFEAVWVVGQQEPPSLTSGDATAASEIRALDFENLEPDEARLLLTSQKQLILFRSVVNADMTYSIVAFQLVADRLWGPRDVLPYNTEFCVFTEAGTLFHCTADIDDSIHASLLAKGGVRRGSIFDEWNHNGSPQYAALWQLFLKGSYGAPALDVIAIQPKSYALESGTDFRHIFIPAMALVIILASLLSMNFINRSLGPLRKLIAAAQQVAEGKLNARVSVETGDEFERLGDAFNHMGDRIEHQISALEAMSNIDRLILTGSKFEQVSESVVSTLIELTRCQSAAVIAHDFDSPGVGTMISLHEGNFQHDRIELPEDVTEQWRQPQQLDLHETDQSIAPYATRLISYGQNFVVLLPVMLHGKLKGVLLLGFDEAFDMNQSSLHRCTDLAGRFAVALASVEREEALYQQAHFDVLTGLPNRQLLKDRLEQSLAASRREKTSGAILFLDLDRFKEINDVFGHSVGDAVLRQSSERIKAVVREQDTVARLGGDEFVVLLPNVQNDSIVRSTAKRLLDKLGEAFTVATIDHYLSASIGITIFPEDGATVETLLKNSDAAMYRAKDAGRGRFEFFSRRLNAESRRKIGLERDLRIAHQRGELRVYYQPQIDITTGEISGAEALLRWTHPEYGSISPSEFIPLAEDSELIVDIGASVIKTVCADLSEILEMRLHPGSTSINVSARQLADTSFASAVMDPIRQNGIHPGFIQLEITETVVAQNRDRAIAILQSLREKGVRVAIDDFGTGYSSLSYLQQLPYDAIKIDKSFIDQIGASDASNNICRTIITMAELLGKTSIAEGVENNAQLEFLQQNRCDFAQGFIYSKPLPKSEFIEFVQQQGFHTQRRRALEIL